MLSTELLQFEANTDGVLASVSAWAYDASKGEHNGASQSKGKKHDIEFRQRPSGKQAGGPPDLERGADAQCGGRW